jgi:glycolate oxidase FAD binding subunit
VTVVADRTLAEFAAEVGDTGPVAVVGGRTRWAVGGELATGSRVVHAPSGIVAYQPEEMTVRVRAGTTVEEFHAELRAHGQRSALPERGGTVGGALAVGENDLAVLGRGRIRDAPLQVRYVSADGVVVTGGGPTVKNVSGFDLPRLLVGSLGTLGLIAEVILRTNPIPPTSRWVRSDDADPFVVATVVLKPSAVLWDGARTWVQLEGHLPDVDAGCRSLGTLGSWTAVAGPPELPPHRWSLTPSELPALGASARVPFVASVGVGTVFAASAPPPRSPSPVLVGLAERVKSQFDPTGRLNPGRRVMSAG